ncbi:MAG: hypothetical protein AB1591_11260 [Pseudomonadota bacterium]
MKKDTLYLHVGWSKTGTSAIQSQIQAQREDFLARGILYPQSLQWPDHSHHPFALSFQGSGVYKSSLTAEQALETLRAEMEASPAPDVLLSSELSPFYFDNAAFRRFVEAHFSRVKVLFTLRCQSELLLSLFNQLVKDPNIRYGTSLFSLAMRNLGRLNFYQGIKRWHEVVSSDNLIAVPYGKDVVARFLAVFGVAMRETQGQGDGIVNPSLPTRCLAVVQARGRKATDNADFIRIRDSVVEMASHVSEEHDQFILFSIAEQQTFDQHFRHDNQLLAKLMQFDPGSIRKIEYRQIRALPPNIRLEKLAEVEA